jgi:hypothetical protein
MTNVVKARVLTWAGELRPWVNWVDPSRIEDAENSEREHLLGQERAGETLSEGRTEKGLP